MWERALAALVFAVTAPGCVAYSTRGASGDDGDPETASPADPASPDEAAPATAKSAAPERCALAEGMEPSRFAPAMPRVAAPDGVVVRSAEVTLELAAGGAVRVLYELELANTGAARVEARVGYSFRLQGGQAESKPTDSVRFDGALEVKRCAAASPPQMHAVYRDETIYAVVPIEPGAEAKVSGEAVFSLQRASTPMTLLGQEDAFAQNLKNFKWSYVKDGAYAAIADRVKPFYGTVALLAAESLRVTIATGGQPWLRAVSFEQNAVPVQAIGAHQLRFGPGEAPSAITFEFNPDTPHAEELDAFRKLSAARPDDLRAGIRVADLLRFGGDAKERISALEKVLAAWDANAEAQLLTGRNDVRAALYVALVRSIEAAGRSADGRKRAAEGVKVAASLDATSEMNRLAARWLEKYLGAGAD